MNRRMTCILCLSIFLWTSVDCSFASNLEQESEGTRTITIHLKNDQSEEIPSWYKCLIRRELGSSDELPYFLPVKDPSWGSANLTYDIQVVLTILGENNYSQVLVSDIPRTDKTMTWVFRVPSSIALDRARLDIDAKGASAIRIKDGRVLPDGDYRFITLCSTWHSLKEGTRGWLSNDNLYGYFNTKLPVEHTYKVVFGHGINYFK